MNDETHITYSVKDLLADIKREQTVGFARLEKGLEHKADAADLDRVERRVDVVAKEVVDLKTWQHSEAARDDAHEKHAAKFLTTWQKIGGFIGLVMIVAATFLAPSVHLFGH